MRKKWEWIFWISIAVLVLGNLVLAFLRDLVFPWIAKDGHVGIFLAAQLILFAIPKRASKRLQYQNQKREE